MELIRYCTRFTRNWIHYGTLMWISVCCLVAAIEGLLGK